MNSMNTIEHYTAPGNTFIAKPISMKKEYAGIILPDEAVEKSFFEIIDLGNQFDHKEFKIGDVVLVNGKGGDRIDIQNGEYWIYPVTMVAAKIIDDEVIPINRFITLEVNEEDEVSDYGGILLYKEKTDTDIVFLKVIRAGNGNIDLFPGMKVVLEKQHCIPVKTKEHSILLTSEVVVLGIVED